MNEQDFYKILGLAHDTDAGRVRDAYRKLAFKHHPDRNPDDTRAEELFKEAAEAYGVLGDPEKRKRFDRGEIDAGGQELELVGSYETSFREETETDLFGEQALLCGGVSAMVKAAFETLVEAGYQPELAYFETMHELKLIVDLMYRGGLNYMRFSVSETAEYGDYVSGPRVTEGAKQAMKDVLADIQSGRFAERWIDEYDSGGAEFNRMRAADHDHQIEQVGARLRSQMAWLDPVEVSAGQAQATTTGDAQSKGEAAEGVA